ncbi:MAG: bifunctional UDP-sugar hydrolase/5'-nucleotidase [Anaerolineales bacterium]|nr:bifunctional UDP-sugar hydrolase/5'-nucleotidase [Anaerolineales bacterium]
MDLQTLETIEPSWTHCEVMLQHSSRTTGDYWINSAIRLSNDSGEVRYLFPGHGSKQEGAQMLASLQALGFDQIGSRLNQEWEHISMQRATRASNPESQAVSHLGHTRSPMTEHLKPLTILHSNDMHGDFLTDSEKEKGKLIGGMALLSGYLNDVRRTEPNVLFLIAGDMLQGSLIDAEHQGISTVEIMNYLAPDAVSLGNHELDYGLRHLLFLEKMANFPIVNANLYIKPHHKRLMRPYLVIEIAGLQVLLIGVITQEVLETLAMESDIATFIGLEDVRAEVARVCNAYNREDIDLTILLTHIGYQSDVALAEMLDPALGVDLIIGGHSHTILDRPTEINGILIAQAGVGTDQIGRFDLLVDETTNSIRSWKWQLIPIQSDLAEMDHELEQFIQSYADDVERKFSQMLCRMPQPLSHPQREQETALGNLVADILAERAMVDVMLVGSGSLRVKEFGPLVTLRSLMEMYPYGEPLYKVSVTGEQLQHIFAHWMRPENRVAGESECFQVNAGVQASYVDGKGLQSLIAAGQPVEPSRLYSLCVQEYHWKNSQTSLGLSESELTEHGGPRVVATSSQDVLEEFFASHQNITADLEGRLRWNE